jgi:hypothetical protein
MQPYFQTHNYIVQNTLSNTSKHIITLSKTHCPKNPAVFIMQPYFQTHNYIVQKTLQFLPCNPTSKDIITLHISLSEIKHYTRKGKINRANQCFHSGLFFFIFESMICISIECTILLQFPFSLAIVDDFSAGVAGFLPYTFPPHPSVVLSVRSIQTIGLGYIVTFSLPDILLGGGGGLGAGAGGCLFQLGSVNSGIFPCHRFSVSWNDKYLTGCHM